jgi:YbbR domain-containing protein
VGDFIRTYVLHNLGLKIFSLLLAIGLWLAVARDPVAEVAVNVPIEFHSIPENLEIDSENVPSAQVRVRGPSRLIHGLRTFDIHVQVDLTNAKPGERTFDLTAQQVSQPRNLDVVQIVPSQFHITLDTRMTRTVEVRPRVTGSFASGLRMSHVLASPAIVTISGPRSRVEAVEAATTDPIDATGVVTSQTFSTNVYVADPLIQVVRPTPVHVTVIMEKITGKPGTD